jgi:excisionase family DNA binding protein
MAREYYSIPEAAARLGLSRIAVFKRVKKGQLEALRFGRNWAVPAAALERAAVPGKELRAPVPKAVVSRPAAPSSKEAAPPSPDSEMDSMGWD